MLHYCSYSVILQEHRGSQLFSNCHWSQRLPAQRPNKHEANWLWLCHDVMHVFNKYLLQQACGRRRSIDTLSSSSIDNCQWQLAKGDVEREERGEPIHRLFWDSSVSTNLKQKMLHVVILKSWLHSRRNSSVIHSFSFVCRIAIYCRSWSSIKDIMFVKYDDITSTVGNLYSFDQFCKAYAISTFPVGSLLWTVTVTFWLWTISQLDCIVVGYPYSWHSRGRPILRCNIALKQPLLTYITTW